MVRKNIVLIFILLLTVGMISPVLGELEPTQLTDNTYNDYYPMIGTDSSGNTYIVWYGYEGGSDSEIFWAKIDPSGAVTTKQITTNTYSDSYPSMNVDAAGNAYIAWSAEVSGADEEIFWAKIDPSGAVLLERQITTNTREDQSVRIAIDAAGNSYLAWHSYTTPPQANENISWALVDASGTVTTRDITTNGYNNFYPEIAIDAAGNSYVAWRGRDAPSGDYEVYMAKVDSSGSFTTTQYTTNTYTESSPKIATDAAGNSYLSWYVDVDGDTDIMWAKIDPTGTVSYLIPLTANDYTDNSPVIHIDSDSNSYIVWRGRPDASYELFWCMIDSSGVATTISQVTDNNWPNNQCSIVIGPEKNTFMVWKGELDPNDEILWAKVDPTGTVTSSRQVTDTTWDDEYPQIALNPSGVSCITWYGKEGNNDREVFFTKIIDMSGPVNLFSPFFVKPVANSHLAKAAGLWSCISEQLPEDVPAELQSMIDDAQAHMANAASMTNPIYSSGEYSAAIDVLVDIIDAYNFECPNNN